MQQTTPSPARPAMQGKLTTHLGMYVENNTGQHATIQFLDVDLRAIADATFRNGAVVRSHLESLSELDAALFIAGCRNILLSKGAVEIALEDAALVNREFAARAAESAMINNYPNVI